MIFINVENLKEGMIVKNYKELCGLLELKVGTGRQKVLQLEMFDRYFEYTKQGHKFIIDVVYLEPLYNVPQHTMYTNLVEELLLDFLVKKQERTGNRQAFYSMNRLLLELNMVNVNYGKYKRNQEELSNKLDIHHEYVNDFYITTNTKLEHALTRTLKKLQSQSLIDVNVVTAINIEFNNNRNDRTTREATEQERDIIISVENELLKQFDCKTKMDVFLKGHWNKFYMQCIGGINDELSSRSFYNDVRLMYYYKAYDIVFNKNIRREHEKVKQYLLDNREDIERLLNREIINNHKLDYINRQDRSIKDLTTYTLIEYLAMRNHKRNRLEMRIDEDYISNGYMIIDEVIKV